MSISKLLIVLTIEFFLLSNCALVKQLPDTSKYRKAVHQNYFMLLLSANSIIEFWTPQVLMTVRESFQMLSDSPFPLTWFGRLVI